MDEVLDDPRAGQALEVLARLAELDADALHRADAEAPTDERIHVDASGQDVAARRGWGDLDPVLGRHRLERLPRGVRGRLTHDAGLPARSARGARLRGVPARRPPALTDRRRVGFFLRARALFPFFLRHFPPFCCVIFYD